MGMKEYEMKLRITREMYYNEENMFGIYACVPVHYTKEIKMNTYGNFSLQGQTRRLKAGEEYVIKFNGTHPNPNPNFDDFYKIVEVPAETLDTVEDQDKFLQAIITENQFNSLKEAYPTPNLLVDLILEDGIDTNKTKGIKSKSLAKIKEQVQKNANISVLIAKLNTLNLSTRVVGKILAHFKTSEAAIDAIEEDIYNLCRVSQLGFLTVDKSALARGDNPTNSNRIFACFKYILEQDNSSGHSWSHISHVLDEASRLLNISDSIIEEKLKESISTNVFYGDASRIALKHTRKQEKLVCEHLWRLRNSYSPPSKTRVESRITQIEEEQGFKFTDEQRNAIINSSQDGVSIINGPGGTGKCVKGDSLVFTDKGLLRIEDIPTYYEVDSNDSAQASIVSYSTKGDSHVRKTSKFYDMGVSDTLKIRTAQGYEIEGTPEHPLLIINESGDLEYKELRDFNGREVVPISIGNNLYGDSKTVSKEISYLMGVITGDGTTSQVNFTDKNKKSYQISITNSHDEIGRDITRIIKDNFGLDVRKAPSDNTWRYAFSSKEVCNKLVNVMGLPACKSNAKYIPKTVKSSPKEVVSSFLQGLFDTDGSMARGVFEYSTASSQLAKEVHVMLLNFGIVANLREKIVKGYEQNTYYIITISNSTFLRKFYEEIGFKNESDKQEKLEEAVFSKKEINSNINILTHFNDKFLDIHKSLLGSKIETYNKKMRYKIPLSNQQSRSIMHSQDKRAGKNGHRKSISSDLARDVVTLYPNVPHADYIKNVTGNLFIDYVESIEESSAHVYDFTVPVTHSFVANGFINHNTTIMKGLIRALGNENYTGAALSGKASNVLSKSGIEASTIHRMLGYDGKEFKYNKKELLPYDIIIIDEASMVNISLFLSILGAMDNGCKIVIVGDSGQLPNIGFGDLLYDMISTKVFPVYELTQVHRQASKSGILELANRIRNGEQVVTYNSSGKETYGELEDQTIFSYSEAEKSNIPFDVLRIAQGYKENVKTPEDLFDFQIFVTNRTSGNLSVLSMNTELQGIFNGGKKPYLSRNNYNFKKDDKIIATGNSYNLKSFPSTKEYYSFVEGLKLLDVEDREKAMKGDVDVYNGTMGIVKHVDVDGKVLFIQFEETEELIAYKLNDLDSIHLAYAISIHRGQGSGIKNIIVAVDFSSYLLLSRQLIYTGITRAIEKGLLLVENNALYTALQRDANTRQTFLKEFLLESEKENGVKFS